MRKWLLTFSLIIFGTSSVLPQSYAYIIPRTVQENQALQVFISETSFNSCIMKNTQ